MLRLVLCISVVVPMMMGVQAPGCDMTTNDEVTNPKAIFIGDSIFDLSGKISDHLEVLSGEQYRDYAVSLEEIADIIAQYERAKTEDPEIRTVIMDGGGNDVLMGYEEQCSNGVSAECEAIIAYVKTELDGLLATMNADGVKHVVFLEYYHLKGDKAKLNQAVDYLDEQLALSCSEAAIDCYFVECRTAFEGHPEYINDDNVHPSDPGSEVLVELIWAVMVENDIEQNEDDTDLDTDTGGDGDGDSDSDGDSDGDTDGDSDGDGDADGDSDSDSDTDEEPGGDDDDDAGASADGESCSCRAVGDSSTGRFSWLNSLF